MASYSVKIKVLAEIEVEAESREEAEEKVWDEIDKELYLSVGDAELKYTQVSDLFVVRY